MTDYKTLFGKKIKFQTSDLTMSTATEGELFYSETDSEFKVGINVIAWTSAPALNLARGANQGQYIGTTTAALVAGGFKGPASGDKATETEEYDGSSWTESGDLSTARGSAAGFGIQTAAVLCGGQLPPTNESKSTEEYNGSTWTDGEDLPIYRAYHAGTGILTAGLICGGATTPGGQPGTGGLTNVTNEYDGTDYSTGGTVNTTNQRPHLVGTQTAGLKFGGGSPGYAMPTESYDGSSWTALPNALNTGRAALGGTGTQTAALGYGGYNAPSATVRAFSEEWDGTSWTATPTLATARTGVGSAGTATAALAIGGRSPSFSTATEEYGSTITLKTLTDS